MDYVRTTQKIFDVGLVYTKAPESHSYMTVVQSAKRFDTSYTVRPSIAFTGLRDVRGSCCVPKYARCRDNFEHLPNRLSDGKDLRQMVFGNEQPIFCSNAGCNMPYCSSDSIHEIVIDGVATVENWMDTQSPPWIEHDVVDRTMGLTKVYYSKELRLQQYIGLDRPRKNVCNVLVLHPYHNAYRFTHMTFKYRIRRKRSLPSILDDVADAATESVLAKTGFHCKCPGQIIVPPIPESYINAHGTNLQKAKGVYDGKSSHLSNKSIDYSDKSTVSSAILSITPMPSSNSTEWKDTVSSNKESEICLAALVQNTSKNETDKDVSVCNTTMPSPAVTRSMSQYKNTVSVQNEKSKVKETQIKTVCPKKNSQQIVACVENDVDESVVPEKRTDENVVDECVVPEKLTANVTSMSSLQTKEIDEDIDRFCTQVHSGIRWKVKKQEPTGYSDPYCKIVPVETPKSSEPNIPSIFKMKPSKIIQTVQTPKKNVSDNQPSSQVKKRKLSLNKSKNTELSQASSNESTNEVERMRMNMPRPPTYGLWRSESRYDVVENVNLVQDIGMQGEYENESEISTETVYIVSYPMPPKKSDPKSAPPSPKGHSTPIPSLPPGGTTKRKQCTEVKSVKNTHEATSAKVQRLSTVYEDISGESQCKDNSPKSVDVKKNTPKMPKSPKITPKKVQLSKKLPTLDDIPDCPKKVSLPPSQGPAEPYFRIILEDEEEILGESSSEELPDILDKKFPNSLPKISSMQKTAEWLQTTMTPFRKQKKAHQTKCTVLAYETESNSSEKSAKVSCTIKCSQEMTNYTPLSKDYSVGQNVSCNDSLISHYTPLSFSPSWGEKETSCVTLSQSKQVYSPVLISSNSELSEKISEKSQNSKSSKKSENGKDIWLIGSDEESFAARSSAYEYNPDSSKYSTSGIEDFALSVHYSSCSPSLSSHDSEKLTLKTVKKRQKVVKLHKQSYFSKKYSKARKSKKIGKTVTKCRPKKGNKRRPKFVKKSKKAKSVSSFDWNPCSPSKCDSDAVDADNCVVM